MSDTKKKKEEEKEEMEAEARCGDCAFYSDKEKCCFQEGGKLFGVKPLSPALADAEHDCAYFQVARFVLTPKALLSIALEHAGLQLSLDQIEEIWEDFADGMERSGYIRHDDEEDED